MSSQFFSSVQKTVFNFFFLSFQNATPLKIQDIEDLFTTHPESYTIFNICGWFSIDSKDDTQFLTTASFYRSHFYHTNPVPTYGKFIIIFFKNIQAVPCWEIKGPILNWSKSVNFWDMTTLIISKDRIFDIVFCGINFEMRQLLVDTHMAQNQK